MVEDLSVGVIAKLGDVIVVDLPNMDKNCPIFFSLYSVNSLSFLIFSGYSPYSTSLFLLL